MRVPVRRDVAMTGEITLRGKVMPIGGVKEKLLAAHRSSIGTVIMPKDNRKDLREVPRRVLKATRIVLVEHMDDVLREALCLPAGAARLFGPPPRERLEYQGGELVVIPASETLPSGVPSSIPGPLPSPKAPMMGPSDRIPPLV
jgi:ATP-dependent Lon protease